MHGADEAFSVDGRQDDGPYVDLGEGKTWRVLEQSRHHTVVSAGLQGGHTNENTAHVSMYVNAESSTPTMSFEPYIDAVS